MALDREDTTGKMRRVLELAIEGMGFFDLCWWILVKKELDVIFGGGKDWLRRVKDKQDDSRSR